MITQSGLSDYLLDAVNYGGERPARYGRPATHGADQRQGPSLSIIRP